MTVVLWWDWIQGKEGGTSMEEEMHSLAPCGFFWCRYGRPLFPVFGIGEVFPHAVRHASNMLV